MQIKNVDMRIINYHNNFITNFMQQIVSLLLVGKTCQYWTRIRISNSLPQKIYCENVVDVTSLLYLWNSNSYESQVKVFNIFIRIVKIG